MMNLLIYYLICTVILKHEVADYLRQYSEAQCDFYETYYDKDIYIDGLFFVQNSTPHEIFFKYQYSSLPLEPRATDLYVENIIKISPHNQVQCEFPHWSGAYQRSPRNLLKIQIYDEKKNLLYSVDTTSLADWSTEANINSFNLNYHLGPDFNFGLMKDICERWSKEYNRLTCSRLYRMSYLHKWEAKHRSNILTDKEIICWTFTWTGNNENRNNINTK